MASLWATVKAIWKEQQTALGMASWLDPALERRKLAKEMDSATAIELVSLRAVARVRK